MAQALEGGGHGVGDGGIKGGKERRHGCLSMEEGVKQAGVKII